MCSCVTSRNADSRSGLLEVAARLLIPSLHPAHAPVSAPLTRILLGQELIALCVQLCIDLVISAIKYNCAQDMHNSKAAQTPPQGSSDPTTPDLGLMHGSTTMQ